MRRLIVKISCIICCFLAFSTQSLATHNRAGEITYDQIGPLTIRATITTYTKASSISADRDTLELFWGDGTSTLVARFNGEGELIPGQDIKINYYISEHTYPGRASYTLSFNDPNRVDNIQNVNFPNSVDVRFYVQTSFTFIDGQFEGLNNSVRLLQAPIDYACVNERFIHNPNAYDPDGDSLSYELIVPLETEDSEVPNYEYPDQVLPGPNNQIRLDPVTGDFVWDSPKSPGEYNIAIKINEYRKGVLLNSVIRDMQIFVDICDSRPPEIETIDEICVIAGDLIEIPVKVTDPDSNQLVRLSVTGGPLLVRDSKAELIGGDIYTVQDLNALLRWQTKCEHISSAYYQLVFRAEDNSNGSSGLSILKTVRVKVVGPPPEGLDGQSVNDNQIELRWDSPYTCEETTNNYFLGFSVWRRENTNPFEIDSCQGGLEGRGYQIIEFNTTAKDNQSYIYVDDFNLEKGKIYCYRILANFALRTPTGNPFNITESLPSAEICLQLKQDIPLITKVSVEQTDINTGAIDVAWIKPLASDFDTLMFPGPYEYRVLRSTDGVIFNEIPGAIIPSPSFGSGINLSYQDTGINTSTQQYYYKIDFYYQGIYYSSSPEASSVFLDIASSDRQNTLSWSEDVAWNNYAYKIYRDSGSGFDSIAMTEINEYRDLNLSNDTFYCYRVESVGTYGLNSVPSPLLNWSQINCGTPLDSVGPCAPELFVDSPCEDNNSGIVTNENILEWNINLLQCENFEDLAGFLVYYSPTVDGSLELIFEIFDPEVHEIIHQPTEGISGCYAISSIDSLGNIGPLSSRICVQNCPVYTLPNTFTPNGDSANDLFVPTENKFVLAVDFQVFNRWGNLVFQTSEPELNWDGTGTNQKELDEGTYYYTCKVFEQGLDGVESQSSYLRGYIQLIR